MIRYIKYLIILAVISGANAQDLSRLTVQTPMAAGLGRYEEIPVDESTGVPNIAIPLFSFRVGDTEFPITLSYHAGGVKVDQLESQVGLSWSLLGFPNISRNVKGIPDENNTGGYFTTVPITNDEIEKRAINAAPYNVGQYENHAFLTNLKSGLNYDLSPDLFSYSLPKGGGKFIYNVYTPEEPEWHTKENLPFLNPLEFVKENLEPFNEETVIEVKWRNDYGIVASIYVATRLIAELREGSYPGWSNLVIKDGPLAKVM
ncbi:hypothetical protein [Sphingobacterium detergens]